MSQEGIKKKGYLLKLPVTGLVKKWAKRWCVLFATSHEGVVRIEYYVDEVSAKSQIGKRTIPLRDSSKIQQAVGDKVHPYVFEFTTQLGQHIFAAENQPELDEWMDGIRDAVHEDRMKRKMNKTQTKRATTSSAAADTSQPQARSSNQKPAADNGYSPAPGGFSKGSTHTASNITSGTYRITLEENDTTDELDLHGSFNLVLAPTTLTIADVNTGKPIYKWHYKYLKSFGKQSGRFNFEVGKTPQGGSGSYRCITTCSKEIFGVVNRNIKIIRERLETAKREQQPNQQQGQPRRPDRRSGVADDTVPGKYRSSQNMEGGGVAIGESVEQQAQPNQEASLTAQDEANNYSLAGQDDDIAALYAKVQKPPKGGAPPTSPFEPQQQQQQGEQQAAAAQQQAPAQSTNRFAYDDTLDTRDSALIQLDGPLLDVEAFTPKKPAPDLSNIMDLELHNDFFSKTASTAATGVDPWGGGGAAQTLGNTGMQSSSPWGSGGGQQFGAGGAGRGGGGQQFGAGGAGGGGVQQFGGGGGQQFGAGGGGGQQFSGGGGQQFSGGGQQYGGGGGQQYGGGGQQYGGGYGGGYGQQAGGGGYGKSTMYGRPAQQGQWSMGGQQQSAAFGRQAPAQAPAQTQPQAPQKALSQQEFDQLWEELNTNF